MINNERYIAAIEISSSKIVGAVGKVREKGHIEVLAIEQEKCVECVRYGIIQNLEETSIRIQRILDKLEKKPELNGRRIAGLYVGLSGRSVRSLTTETSMPLPPDTEIDDRILRELREKALSNCSQPGLEMVDAVPRSYKVGNIDTKSPKGTIGSSISATFDIIVCRPELRRNLMRTIGDKLGIRIEGFIITAMATGAILISDDEKRLGCMLVDLGAETTTVTIYKYGHLLYFATLPLGGRNITRDLTSLNMLEERAEEVKNASGSAIIQENMSQVNVNGLKLTDVNNIVVARSEEIVANIVETTEYAGLTEKDLPGGCICIGGGSKLNGILELIREKSNLPVRRASLPPYIRLDDAKAPTSESLEVISILYEGAILNDAECLETRTRTPLPANGDPNMPGQDAEVEEKPAKLKKARRRSFISNIRDRVTGFFSAEDDDDTDIE